MTDLPPPTVPPARPGLLTRLTTNTYLNGSLGTGILVVALTVTVWAVRLDIRVVDLETRGSPMVIELDKKLALINERQVMMSEQLRDATAKIDNITSIVNRPNNKAVPLPKPRPRPKLQAKPAPKVVLPQQGPSITY